MSGSLTLRLGPEGPRLLRGPALPVAALLVGRPPMAAAELLPRLFNLCPVAQATAVRLALDLPLPDPAELAAEIAREHRQKVTLLWPRLLDLPAADPGPLPAPEDLTGWVARQPLFAALARLFPPGTAVADLPAVTAETMFAPTPCDNSPAARRQDHPTLSAAARLWGRGPLWRALGRLADLAPPPPPVRLACGTAVVPAARGSYAVRARIDGGRVTAFARMTPTDHLIAPGGILERSLATLPPDSGRLLPVLLALLDPCVPVTVEEAAHA
ncbi:HupK protein [Cereibacter johrii]|uniref:HupK protein n=1 Tax=Cereibacter johrii TaxID=445629 RepID=UPI002B25C9E1|nr:HupK protein [Cereibacter johrii]MEA5160130.1 HupK protein [Cereibacter johrii]